MLKSCLGFLMAGLCAALPLAAQNTFQKTYGGTEDDFGSDLVLLDDGYVIAGNTFSGGPGGRDALLLKIDLNGNVVWQKTYGGFDADEFTQATKGNDGGILAVGNTYSHGAGGQDFWVVKTDDFGTVQWSKTIGGDLNETATLQGKILRVDNGYVLSFAQLSKSVGSGQQTCIIRIDNLGNVVWERTYLSLIYNIFGVTDMAAQGQVFYAGGGVDGDACLVVLDANTGGVVSSRLFSGDGNESLYNVSVLPDTSLLLSDGTWSPSGSQYISHWLMKTSQSGIVEWSKVYTQPGGMSLRGVAIPTPEGGFFSTPYNAPLTINSDAYMVKYDATGNIQWAHCFGGDHADRFTKGYPTADGGYIAVGQSEKTGAGATDILVVKVNADGLVDGCCKKDLNLEVADYFPPTFDQGYNELDFFLPDNTQFDTENSVPITGDFCSSTQPTRNDTIALCPGEPYDFQGSIFFAPDEVTTLIPGPACDTALITHFVLRQYVVSDFGVQLFCPGGFVTINGVIYDQPGTIMDTLTNNNGLFCDTIGIYTIVRLENPTLTQTITFCPGESVMIGGQVYDQPGTVVDTIPSTTSCDTIATYILVQNEQVTVYDTLTICPGDTIYLNGQAYTQAGTVSGTLPSTTGGCDTLAFWTIQQALQDFVLTLNSFECVNGSPVIHYQVCNLGSGGIPFNNLYVTFYDSNPFEVAATALGAFIVPGADSCVSANTSALPFDIPGGGTIYAVINDNGTHVTPFSPNDFPHTDEDECNYGNNLAEILIDPPAPPVLDLGPDVTICKDTTIVFDAGAGFVAYLWQDGSTDQTYAATAHDVYWVEVTDNCGFKQRDSVALIFSLLPDTKYPDQAICPGASVTVSIPGYDAYAWAPAAGLSCTDCAEVIIQPDATTTYTVEATSQLGCSLRDTFTISILPLPTFEQVIEFCPGDIVVINNQSYTESATVLDTIVSTTTACDSIVTYHLILLPQPTRAETIEFCPGTSVEINGQSYTQPGTVVETISSTTSTCDTIVTYTLVLLPQPTRAETIEFCPGTSVEINGQSYTQSGTVVDTIPSTTAACDTIVTYTLVLLPQPAFSQTIEFCKGDNVVIHGQTYSTPGTVLVTLPSTTGGCDTLATYILQYLTPSTPTAVTITCPQDVVVETQPGGTSVVVNFDDATATTDCPCPGISLEQSAGLNSGSAFPVGNNEVCFAAADSCGNTASCCFTVSVQAAADACDTKVIGCMKYEIIGITKDAAQNHTFTIRVTNNCTSKLIYTAIQLPNGVTAIDPATGTTYTSPSGRNYVVRNPNYAPFYSVRFKAGTDGIVNGASDVFQYTLPAQSNVPTFIHITSRLETQTFYEAHLNTFYCPVTPTPVSSHPVLGRSFYNNNPNTLSVFPNPLSGSNLFADLSDWSGQTVQIRIMDARGSEVLNQPFAATEQTSIQLPAGLAAGIYFLEALPADGDRQTVRFVIVQ